MQDYGWLLAVLVLLLVVFTVYWPIEKECREVIKKLEAQDSVTVTLKHENTARKLRDKYGLTVSAAGPNRRYIVSR